LALAASLISGQPVVRIRRLIAFSMFIMFVIV
jgi:hypothetical protein